MCTILSDKATRTRISLKLTKVYVEALDKLVDVGVYEDRAELIKDGMRRIFRQYEMKPFLKFFEETD